MRAIQQPLRTGFVATCPPFRSSLAPLGLPQRRVDQRIVADRTCCVLRSDRREMTSKESHGPDRVLSIELDGRPRLVRRVPCSGL